MGISHSCPAQATRQGWPEWHSRTWGFGFCYVYTRALQGVDASAAPPAPLSSAPATPTSLGALDAEIIKLTAQYAAASGKESELPNFKGSYLGRFPLVSADFWTSDHRSERSRRVDAFSGTRARGTLTLKRR